MFLKIFVAILAILPLTGVAGADDALRSAVNNDARPAEERARDVYRNPYETLRFFGIEADQTVVELFPGNGWYTAILKPYLAEHGRFVAAHFSLQRDPLPPFYERVLDGYKERFPDAEIAPFNPPEQAEAVALGEADRVLTFRNIHSWLRDGQLDDVFAAAHTMLRPGGVFGVVGHRLPEDCEQDPEAASGYVKESLVIATAEAAGFRLAERSEINANPEDTADHPDGVWMLPPQSRVPDDADADHFAAIGESDRFTLKFVRD
ncbi:methyltransferase [Methylonatrum kenyense]|uniref:class I SAM-dependent methyltransferase n=1 Tax=Methylonatrum kenyense TaxID=455253 RepID=UPI0020BECABD|nr:methyltransferase [Methylonatrum kenyense]MCK8515361.1 methyltransferase [Methylonatrum kenyense]